jgi:hypothetical protein
MSRWKTLTTDMPLHPPRPALTDEEHDALMDRLRERNRVVKERIQWLKTLKPETTGDADAQV